MTNLLPIASGKGGVGKSVLAANLGLALARRGKAVVLVDLDLGGSNLHTFLGVRNRHPGLGALVWRHERKVAELLVETRFERLWLVPGDGLLPATANLDWFAKKRILKELAELPADYAILDLGAGSSYNVVDFFLASSEGLLVIRPEITSVLNAYSFLKTATYRIMARAFKEGSPGRAAMVEYISRKPEGPQLSFADFAAGLAESWPEQGREPAEALRSLRPRVLMNMGRGVGDAALGQKLAEIAERNLGLRLEFLGYVRDDEAVAASVAARTPLVATEPSSAFSLGVEAAAALLCDGSKQWGGPEDGPAAALEALIARAFAAR